MEVHHRSIARAGGLDHAHSLSKMQLLIAGGAVQVFAHRGETTCRYLSVCNISLHVTALLAISEQRV